MSQHNVWDLLVYAGFGIKSHGGGQGIFLGNHGWPVAAGRAVGCV